MAAKKRTWTCKMCGKKWHRKDIGKDAKAFETSQGTFCLNHPGVVHEFFKEIFPLGAGAPNATA